MTTLDDVPEAVLVARRIGILGTATGGRFVGLLYQQGIHDQEPRRLPTGWTV